MEKYNVLSVLVDNTPGLLLRVAGLFNRRAYNIASVVAAETEDPAITRMTIVVYSSDDTLEQVQKQLMKLVDVREVKVLNPHNAVCREHLLIKMENSDESRTAIVNIACLFDAKIIDSSEKSITCELTGEHDKLNSFINMLRPYGIKQLTKSGISAQERG